MELELLSGWLFRSLSQWGYLLLFLMTLLETGAFLGILVPGETLIILGGVLASQGVLRLDWVIWSSMAGAALGDSLAYLIGRRYGGRLVSDSGGRFHLKREHLERVGLFFERYGGKALVLGRFFGWVRPFSPFAAGMGRMGYPRFLFFDLYGVILWAILFPLLGFLAGNSWDVVKGYLGEVGLIAGVAVAIALVAFIAYRRRRRSIKRQLRAVEQGISGAAPRSWAFIKARFRPHSWQGLSLTVALLLLSIALVAFVSIVEGILSGDLLFYMDAALLGVVERIFSPALTRWMVVAVDFSGAYLLLVTAIGMALSVVWRREWSELVALAFALGVGQFFVDLLTMVFQRPSPTEVMGAFPGLSFPSREAFEAVVVYGFLTYLTWTRVGSEVLRFLLYTVAVGLTLMVGLSSIYLEVNWFTDVLAGYAVGAAWLLFSIVLGKSMGEQPPR